MAKLNMCMINMYCNMIDEEFETITTKIQIHNERLRDAVEGQVKRECGYYELEAEAAALLARLKEINKLIGLESTYYQRHGSLEKEINATVDARLKGQNAKHMEIHKTISDLKKTIKLGGVGDDVSEIFIQLPSIVERLEQETQQILSVKPDTIKIAA